MGMLLLAVGRVTAGLMFSICRSDQIIELVEYQGYFFIGDLTAQGAVLGHPALEQPPEQKLDGFRGVPSKKGSHDLFERRIK